MALIVLLALISALAVPSIALAGGWAVITLDRLPDGVVAGQPYSLGMMVRQHGRTPWIAEEIAIQARQAETRQSVSFVAKPQGEPGHYQAVLLFPEAGTWEWTISSGLFPEQQPMPVLQVAGKANAAGSAAASSPGVAAAAARIPAIPTVLLGASALLAFIGGAALIVRRQGKPFRTLAGAALLVLFGVLALATFNSTNVQASRALTAASSVSEASTGQRLFIAKGCIVCHVNDRALALSEEYGIGFGPNLTAYSNDPSYLQTFLKDPQALKPGTEMPDLGLSEVEINALISFINEED